MLLVWDEEEGDDEASCVAVIQMRTRITTQKDKVNKKERAGGGNATAAEIL